LKPERQLVETIAGALGRAGRSENRRQSGGGVRLGIGDDAAVLKLAGDREWVISCDASIEDIHFRLATHPADSIGYKSLIRAVSDLAAMGAEPRYFLLTMALPGRLAGRWLDEFLRGMARAATKLGIRAIGGDTTNAASVSIGVTVMGEIAAGKAVTRAGARTGDSLYVSGRLGAAELGLRLTLAGHARALKFQRFVRPHLYPNARTGLGAWLAARGVASSMIDLSDGLSTDLVRLCLASRVGAKLSIEKIPTIRPPEQVLKALHLTREDALPMALEGGEDYELLFTVDPSKAKLLVGAPGYSELTQIGRIVRGAKVLLADRNGRETRLKPGGWDSFRKKSVR
jgi:thiamine-monophosphate kinase